MMPAQPNPDADTLVELVDGAGRPCGKMPKLAAHRAPGSRHRAVSAFLLDSEGRLVLQRRAGGKYHSAGLWSNTCCGHPSPGEAPLAAAARRITEELGVPPGELHAAEVITYEVTDPVSGLVEHEWNHVFVGHLLQAPDPDPSEVSECAFVAVDDLEPVGSAAGFTAWFPVVLRAALPALGALGAARMR